MKTVKTRIEEIERKRRPPTPAVVRWDLPTPGQMDIRTRREVSMFERVTVVAYLRTREQWEML